MVTGQKLAKFQKITRKGSWFNLGVFFKIQKIEAFLIKLDLQENKKKYLNEKKIVFQKKGTQKKKLSKNFFKELNKMNLKSKHSWASWANI